jgi:hypothetical protein
MPTETKAATTPETGTPAVKQETKTEGNTRKTTSQGLFGDLMGRNIPGTAALAEPVEPPKPAETPVKEEPKPEAKPGPRYLSSEEFSDALVKLKVDGVEEDAKFQDVIRRVQLDKHLTLKGQKLSEEERRVKEKEAALAERERVLTELIASQSKPKTEDGEAESLVKDDPYVKRIEAELKRTQDVLTELTTQTAPMVLRASLDRVANHVKTTLGQDDFMSYQDKIKDYLVALPPEQARAMDNEAGWLSVYKDLKLQELFAKASEPKKPEPTPQAERPAPKTVPVESGKNSSSGVNDDEASKYRALVDRAKRLTNENSTERHRAWEEVLAFKSRNSG